MTEPRISQQAGFDKIEDDLILFLNASTLSSGAMVIRRTKWDELLAYISIKFFKAWMSGWHQGTQDEKSRMLLFLNKARISPTNDSIGIAELIDFVRNKE